MLKPNKDIHKVLISTSSLILGEYESEETSIQLSFPTNNVNNLRLGENPYSRTYMVITFKNEPDDGSIFLRNLSIYGDYFCTFLSILYGKEFNNHGMLETHGIHRLPTIESNYNEKIQLPQYNFSPRADLNIPLNLEHFKLIEPILIDDVVSVEFLRMIIAAGKFYNRALRIFPNEPELAYLDLITCGEIISNFNEEKYTDSQLYDEDLLNNFIKISEIDGGDRIVRDLKKRLYQVKRKFVFSLSELLNDNFFNLSEVKEGIAPQINKENINNLLKSAYDLRSQYVHAGAEFGVYITPFSDHNNEVLMATPRGFDEKVNKILSKSPTFCGLERIIRFCLLRLIHKNGLEIHDDLN
ncbi:hypothetical protein ACQKML_24430 [Peribacillus frigoritolerans]